MVYFGFKFIFRLATPFFVRYISRKADQRFQSFFDGFANQNPQSGPRDEEGKVSVDKIPKGKMQSKKKVGEYIEYEEVDW